MDGVRRREAGGLWHGALAWARSAGPRPTPGPGAIVADAAVAAAFAGAAVDGLRLDHYRLLSAGPLHVPGQVLVLTLAATVPLVLRRTRPLAAFWIMLAATPGIRDHMTVVIYLAVIVAGYSAIVHSRFRGAAMLAVPLAGGLVLGAIPAGPPPFPARAMPLAILAAIAVIGDAVRRWRGRAGDSQARIGRMQAEHQQATRRVLAAERARLASEMHDVVTHNVSVMVVQAGAARQILAAAPGRAQEALLAVESSGRAAMAELGALLGLLAPAGHAADPADPAGTAGADGLRPQPGLRQLDSLIDRVTAAGLRVRLHVSGTPAALSPGADLAAYRTVQEALTNVLKHASHAETRVRLGYRPGELVVEVSDEGEPAAGGAAPADGAAWDTAAGGQGRGTGSGRGLAGLRQRLELCGGELHAGPQPGGGWRVTARLPVPAQTATGPPASYPAHDATASWREAAIPRRPAAGQGDA
ncbi:MAG TPA: histidine kinase [Streptosporangiaceae bacterium]